MTDTDPTSACEVREQLLDALDFSYCQGLGYTTPEALLAAYDASRAAGGALRDRIAEAHRPVTWWMVETRAGAMDRWAPDKPHDTRQQAVDQCKALDSTVGRRIVRGRTTYTVAAEYTPDVAYRPAAARAAQAGCLFCQPDTPANRITARTSTCYTRLDNYPAAPGHIEIVPARHVESILDLTPTELADAHQLLRQATAAIGADGYTIGVNEGRAAGRTVDHVHIHVIPRWHGDVEDPRGGVRRVLPGQDPDQWAASVPVEAAADDGTIHGESVAHIAGVEDAADDAEPVIEPYCDGFPTTCPNRVTVPPAPPRHDGGIRCGCYDDPTA